MEAYVATRDQGYVTYKTGVSQPNVSRTLARPEVQAEVTRREQERLSTELLPLAVDQHKALLASDRTPAGAKINAIGLVYKHTLDADSGQNAKEMHEMTWEELDAERRRLAARAVAIDYVLSDRAEPINGIAEDTEAGVFD